MLMQRCVRRACIAIASRILHPFGYRAVPAGLGYFRPEDLLPYAKQAGETLCEYLESRNIGGVGRRRDVIVQRLLDNGVFTDLTNVVEIGPGTGMYLERMLALACPRQVEIYETSLGWRKYLTETYRSGECLVVPHIADGRSLSHTPDSSVDAVFAHAVFVYLPVATVIAYIEEACRVLKHGGLLVFDCFLDSYFTFDVLQKWRRESPEYDFPVILSREMLAEAQRALGFQSCAQFDAKYHAATTQYLVWKANKSVDIT